MRDTINVFNPVTVIILLLFSFSAICLASAAENDNMAITHLFPFSYSIESRDNYFRAEISAKALVDSLKSPAPDSRILAVHRLTELNDDRAVPAIIEAYENEPITKQRDIDAGQGFKYYSLVAIGVLGGPEAGKFLCALADNLIFKGKEPSEYGDDALDIGIGIIDGLSMTKSACAKEILNRIIERYESIERPNPTLMFAYTAKNRFIILEDEQSEKIQELLEHYKALEDSIDDKGGHTSTIEKMRKTAMRINLREIGIADPSVLRDYKSGLSTSDPFITKLDEIINSADNWRVRLGK